jgi:hypothetical protein
MNAVAVPAYGRYGWRGSSFKYLAMEMYVTAMINQHAVLISIVSFTLRPQTSICKPHNLSTCRGEQGHPCRYAYNKTAVRIRANGGASSMAVSVSS